MKSISTGFLCKALAIFRLVICRAGNPLSILAIVEGETPAFIAKSRMDKAFSMRISFIVFTAKIITHKVHT